MTIEKKKRVLENIYDLVKVTGLSNKQNDEWAKLSREHAEEARKEMKQFIERKEIRFDCDSISIGRDFKIELA